MNNEQINISPSVKKTPGPKPLDQMYLKQALTERFCLWVVRLQEEGFTVPQIADFVGLTKQAVYDRLYKNSVVTTMGPKQIKEKGINI